MEIPPKSLLNLLKTIENYCKAIFQISLIIKDLFFVMFHCFLSKCSARHLKENLIDNMPLLCEVFSFLYQR